MRNVQECEDQTVEPVNMCAEALKPERDMGLERRVQLHRLAEDIAFMLRGRTTRDERCVIRSMVQTLLDGDR